MDILCWGKRLSSSDPQTTAYETCYQLLSNEDGSFDIKNPETSNVLNHLLISISQ